MYDFARRRAFAAAALLALSAVHANAQTCPDPRMLARDLQGPLAAVRFLADDALEGRLAGSAGERCAGDYIAARLEALGLQGAGTDGSFFQAVPLAISSDPHGGGHAVATSIGRNVVALLEGSDPSVRDELVIVGAHYDHLGFGSAGSLEPGRTAIHNGADDNASGIAALLDVAAELANRPRPARSVLFIAFTGEEMGLLGSAHFVRAPTVPIDGAKAMLNMDMVGRLEDDPLIVYGVGTAAEWPELVEAQARRAGVAVALQPDGIGPSDHTSFYLRDIPVLHFFTNTHLDYHRPSDDWQRIDAPGIECVARLVTGITRELAGSGTSLTLVKGAGRPAGPPRSGSGAWLGTVPDFAPVDRGVRLAGVTAGSPAEAAGLRKGDVLIRVGDHEVTDLQGFTDALRAHEPGDEVKVVVIRGSKEVSLTAVLGRRGG